MARGSNTVSTKSLHVIDVVRNTSAASGSSTSALRKNVVKPSVSPKPGRMLGWRNQEEAISTVHGGFGPGRVHDQHGMLRRLLQQRPEPVPLDGRRVRGAQHQHAAAVRGEFRLQLFGGVTGPQL